MMNTWKNSKTMLLFSALFFVQTITFYIYENNKLALIMLVGAVIELICGVLERKRELKAAFEGDEK
ncbi:MAG: hypothetical protein K6F75_06725 [Butyrivibrio sp.]|nr:hypothetical protein [Butyrivibrio sp.]